MGSPGGGESIYVTAGGWWPGVIRRRSCQNIQLLLVFDVFMFFGGISMIDDSGSRKLETYDFLTVLGVPGPEKFQHRQF